MPTGVVAVGRSKRNPDEWKAKPIVMQMRGSPEYKAWLERLAEFDRSSISDLADRAIAKHARDIGFTESPPRR